MTTHAVGIDLGTTYSAVARLDETGRTAMVRNSQGELLTPSVVLFDDHEIVVGSEARKALATETGRVAQYVKREMGAAVFSRPIRGKHLPPEVIQSCILRKLRGDTITALGPDFKVVITVPAYFDEPRRKATADAGEMATLEVLDIVNEPTAAALAFGEQLGYLDPAGAPRGAMKILVYDLGGGTFDVTLLDLHPGNLRTLATDGDVCLGGHDWDMRLVDFVAAEFISRHGADPREDPSSLARLLWAAEDAKHTLEAARDHAGIHVEHAEHCGDVAVTRQRFEDLTADLLERTAYTTRQVLASAQVGWTDITHILLTGGSTRMPMVGRMLAKLSGKQPEHTVNPDEAVARGAAIYAGHLLALRDERGKGPTFNVSQVNAHSLGIEGLDQRTLHKENVVLIPRNTPLPRRVSEKFVTKVEAQTSIVIQVLEGESKSPSQCTSVARAVLRGLPANLPRGWPVEVSYEYATNGRLSVRANVPGTKSDLAMELEREGGLSAEGLARWKRVVTADRGFSAFEDAVEEALALSSRQPAESASAGQNQLAAGAAPHAEEASPGDFEAEPQRTDAAPAVRGSLADFSRRRSRPGSWIVTIVGHLLASTLGLAIGYYILCLISPESNFLNLSLPGISSPKQPTDSQRLGM